jgi:hypothetical protein
MSFMESTHQFDVPKMLKTGDQFPNNKMFEVTNQTNSKVLNRFN